MPGTKYQAMSKDETSLHAKSIAKWTAIDPTKEKERDAASRSITVASITAPCPIDIEPFTAAFDATSTIVLEGPVIKRIS